jgi:putative nucleotidyltransferase with HDIG domain
MKASRLAYRLRQFWDACFAAPSQEGLDRARRLLNPSLFELFKRMQPSEQAHSLKVMQVVEQASLGMPGEARIDLLVAALLHDVGKTRYPLTVWERAWVVVGRAFTPALARRWADGKPSGWGRAFVVAERHPEWGAQMAAQAGASPVTVALIRRHQEAVPSEAGADIDPLLRLLQSADQEL